MALAIRPNEQLAKAVWQPYFGKRNEQKVSQVFFLQVDNKPLAEPVKKNFFSKVDLQPLIDAPWDGAEGAFWGGFCLFGAYNAAESLSKLYEKVCDAAATTEKVGLAVKSVVVESLSLVSSASYLARWANMSKIVDLGALSPVVHYACYGASGLANFIEAGEQIYHIRNRVETIESGGSPEKVEKHRKWLCHGLIKLVGHVTMVAWGVLGVAGLATGTALGSVVMPLLLGVGLVLGLTAAFYKYHLDKTASIPELCESHSEASA